MEQSTASTDCCNLNRTIRPSDQLLHCILVQSNSNIQNYLYSWCCSWNILRLTIFPCYSLTMSQKSNFPSLTFQMQFAGLAWHLHISRLFLPLAGLEINSDATAEATFLIEKLSFEIRLRGCRCLVLRSSKDNSHSSVLI